MKTLIKITKRLLVILLFVSLTNCERDKIHSETEQEGVKRIHRISIADFNSKVAKNKKYDKLQSYFDTYISNESDSQSRIEQGDNVTIQTDEVLLIQTDSIDYYTFKLLTNNTDNIFYNLVVNVNDQDEIAKSVIFEYNPSDNWLQDTTQAYSGYVSVADNDIISLEDLFTAKFGDECIIGSTSYWICNENVLGHYEGHPSCDQATAWENVVTPIYAPCDELTSGNYYIAGDEDNADGGGPTNGGTGNPPNDNDPLNDEEDVASTIPTPADYVAPIIDCINGLGQTDGVTLSQDMIDWLNETNDKSIANPLTQTLDNASCSEVAQQQVMEELLDLYDDYQIINELEDKALCVYNKLKDLNSGFKNAIKKFDGEFPVAHLKFEADPTMSSNTKKAYTRPPENYVIDIVLNGNPIKDASYQKRPNLLVAKTIIHEVIHAEMFRKLLSLSSDNGEIDPLVLYEMVQNGNYPGILDYYMRYGINGFQHQQMAEHYRETIARMLQEYDTGITIADNVEPDQLYLDLAWEGLIYSDIVAWQEIMDDTERARIEGVIQDYITDNPNETCVD